MSLLTLNPPTSTCPAVRFGVFGFCTPDGCTRIWPYRSPLLNGTQRYLMLLPMAAVAEGALIVSLIMRRGPRGSIAVSTTTLREWMGLKDDGVRESMRVLRLTRSDLGQCSALALFGHYTRCVRAPNGPERELAEVRATCVVWPAGWGQSRRGCCSDECDDDTVQKQ